MTSTRRVMRGSAALLGAVALVLATAGPAHATPPPAPVTDVAATLGAHGVVLTWSPSGSGPALVRDVTGLSPGYAPGDGRSVSATGSQAYDTAFTNLAQTRYAVWASDSDGTTSPTATELVVDPLPRLATATVLDPLPTALLAGRSLVVTGKVTRAGLPLPGVKVQLRSRVGGGATESPVVTVTSGLDGALKATYVPLRTRTYRFAFGGDSFSTASSSATAVVSMQPRVAALLSPTTIPWKKSSVLRGSVAPNLAGRVVTVQEWYGGSYHSVARRTLTSASTFSYSTAPSVGKHGYRVVLPGEVGFRSAVSPGVVLTVVPRTLYQGLSGPDVLALERRLAALHYDVGTVDGVFDYDLRHGVTAFQKVERLAITGQWKAADRARVLKPLGFKLRYGSDDGLVAEVSITRQVLVLHRGTKVLKIVDVSTGSEKPYYQDGVEYVAHTPRGVFRIFHKIDGIRVSKLGELYRPSYFYKGWAIHGNSSVPTYPASHGCVRITNHVADRLFSVLAIGTKVAVYDE